MKFKAKSEPAALDFTAGTTTSNPSLNSSSSSSSSSTTIPSTSSPYLTCREELSSTDVSSFYSALSANSSESSTVGAASSGLSLTESEIDDLINTSNITEILVDNDSRNSKSDNGEKINNTLDQEEDEIRETSPLLQAAAEDNNLHISTKMTSKQSADPSDEITKDTLSKTEVEKDDNMNKKDEKEKKASETEVQKDISKLAKFKMFLKTNLFCDSYEFNGPLFNETEKSQENKDQRLFTLCLSLIGVLCFTLADTCLYFAYSDGAYTNNDRWFGMMLRSAIQIVTGVIMSIMVKKYPWGPGKKLAVLITIGIFAALLISCLDGASRKVPSMLQVTFELFTPVITLVFVLSLCLEHFVLHRAVSIICLGAAALIISQPQILGASIPTIEPIFNQDVIFSTPISTRSLPENIHYQCLNQSRRFGELPQCSIDIMGFIYVILAPIVSSYLVILLYICNGVNIGAVLMWQGLGFLAVTIYGVMDSSDFSTFDPNFATWIVTMLILHSILSIIGTVLLILVIRKSNPTRAIVLLWLKVILVLILQKAFVPGKNFAVNDLVGGSLIAIAVSHLILEQLFY